MEEEIFERFPCSQKTLKTNGGLTHGQTFENS